MIARAKKTAPSGSKKGTGSRKSERGPAVGGGSHAPLASAFEDDDMYHEPIKKVGTYRR